jgi:TldD protein
MDPSDQRDLCQAAIDAALSAGARYAEARFVTRERENIQVRNGSAQLSNHQRDVGIGIRTLVGNGWGYAGTNILDKDAIVRASRSATKTAQATDGAAGIEVVIPQAMQSEYRTPLQTDPFTLSQGEKLAPFTEAHERIEKIGGIKVNRGNFVAHRQETSFLASNGSDQYQQITLCGGGVSAIAQANGDVQIRSLPKGMEGNFLQGGFEHIVAMNLGDSAEQAAQEALALTQAERIPEGKKTIILDGCQLSLQIHESVGHPTELDRVLGEEISLAGSSFLLPSSRNELRYGSDLVNLTADSTTPYGPGTFGFDDEGTPASRSPIVEDGQLVGFLSGRDTAQKVGCRATSALRAESWASLPIVRMVNVNLEPGKGSLDDLIGGVDDGYLLAANKSWSIDDLRLNFQFSCEIAYEIKNGRRTGKIFKNPIYYGVTPQFWGSCSAIAGPEAWKMWGWLFCGKGDPAQLMYVGHGCAPSRFDGIRVGSS